MLEGVTQLPDGRRLAYAIYGPADGRPVMMMHGSPGSRLDGALFDTKILTSLQVQLIIPDRPGLGRSDEAPRRTLASWPNDLARLADALGFARFAVAGTSGGGPYALACAAALPGRVTALGLISSLGPMTDAKLTRDLGPNRFFFTPWLAPIFVRLMHAGMGEPQRMIERVIAALPPADRACFVQRPELGAALLASIREAFRHGPRGLVHDARLLGGPWPIPLERLTLPVQLWHGEDDRNASLAMGRHLAGRIPSCAATFYPNEGHFGPLCWHSDAIFAALLNAPAEMTLAHE